MKQVWQKFLAGGLPGDPSPAQVRQTTFANSFSAIAILVFVVFGFVNVFQERQLLVGAVELAMAMVNIANLFILRVRKGPLFASRVLLASAWLLLVLLLVTGGIERTGIYWYFTLPPAAYFLLRRRESDTDHEVCKSGGTCTGLVNLETNLVSTYLSGIPVDPTGETTNGAGYHVVVDTTGGTNRVTVCAPDAELSQTISITR